MGTNGSPIFASPDVDSRRQSRRKFLGCLGLAAIPASWAQPVRPTGATKVGWLALRESIFREPYSLAFVSRMAELGYVEGTNLTLERHHVSDRIERMAEGAKSLVATRPNILFSGGGDAAFVALKEASQGIPTVFVSVDFDPVLAGHVDKMSRPSGAMTGVSGNQSQLPAKRLELLKVMLPRTKRVAVFSNRETTGQLAIAAKAADELGLQLKVIEFASAPFNFELAYEQAVHAKSDALLVLGSSLFVSARQKIPQLALAHRLPTVCHQSQWAEMGALMSYGYSFQSMWRTGAEMVAKIIQGVPVSEIPWEWPTRYELAINLTTARLLGVDIPYEMKLRADRLIG